MTPPSEEQLLTGAARTLIREDGARNLTVDAVLSRAGLGTRAFYRHFTSKDHLVVEVFASAAEEETARLRTLMASARHPLGAIVAWIDGRLDLAFDPNVRSDLRQLSEQAQSLYAARTETMDAAYATMLAPLVDAIQLWRAEHGVDEGDAIADARTIHDVVWGTVQQQWMRGDRRGAVVRPRIIAFCLRGIGASSTDIATATSSRRAPRRRRS